MVQKPVPTFDEWVDYCFTQGMADFRFGAETDSKRREVEARSESFLCIPPPILAEYLPRLFWNPGFIADRFSHDQIADGIWFLFGCASAYYEDLRFGPVSAPKQIECISCVGALYTQLLDRVCCRNASEPDGDFINKLSVDGAVYMIWDDGIRGAVCVPEQHPHLVDPGFAVLRRVLHECRTSSCRISALHGLGHLYLDFPERVERLIDEFLDRTEIPDWVVRYASDAREGCVL